jgi:hypothetical protein
MLLHCTGNPLSPRDIRRRVLEGYVGHLLQQHRALEKTCVLTGKTEVKQCMVQRAIRGLDNIFRRASSHSLLGTTMSLITIDCEVIFLKRTNCNFSLGALTYMTLRMTQ